MAYPKSVIKNGLKSMRQPRDMSMNVLTPETIGSKPEYPHGLRLTLNKDALKALGKTAKDFSVGAIGDLAASCKICSIHSDEEGDRVELQITALNVD